MGAQEPVVGQNFNGDIKTVGPTVQHCLHPPFASFGDAQCGDFVPFDCASNFARKAAAVLCVRQLYIIHCPTCAAQILRMVTHG